MSTPMERSELEDLYTEEAQLQRQLNGIPSGRMLEGIGLRHRLAQVRPRIVELEKRGAWEARKGWESEKEQLHRMLVPALGERTTALLLELAEGRTRELAAGDLEQAGEALKMVGQWAAIQAEAQWNEYPEVLRQDGRGDAAGNAPQTPKRNALPGRGESTGAT